VKVSLVGAGSALGLTVAAPTRTLTLLACDISRRGIIRIESIWASIEALAVHQGSFETRSAVGAIKLASRTGIAARLAFVET